MNPLGLGSCVVVFLLLASACSSKRTTAASENQDTNTPSAEESDSASTSAGTAEVISSARDSIKEGKVAEAAARLATLQVQGASFNAQQAKDYRQALSDAYDRAYEAIQRGDPKGQEALQLLRAASPR